MINFSAQELQTILIKKMNNTEILSNLRTLGLDAGATADDIHTAFRKLARELHPDITGSRSDYRFKQITSAYTFLKSITPEELDALNSQPIKNKDIFDYYSDRKKYKINDEKINAIIDKYEAELKSFYPGRAGLENFGMDALILRLKSENPKVINAALKHAGNLVNRVEFRRAFAAVLNKKEIDEGLAEIINSLPFEDGAKKLIALDSANNAANFPTGLITALIGNEPDADVMESFLMYVRPDDVAVILRRWPEKKIMNAGVLRKLLSSDDARVLVPVLSVMKNNFPNLAAQNKKRLKELENHSVAAVRAWAKKCS